MADLLTIDQVLYQWVTGQIVNPVIFANQDGIRPKKPYITLQVLSETRDGQPEIEPVDADGTITLSQSRTITVSVQAIGEQVLGLIACLRDSLSKISVQQIFRSLGLVYIRVLSGPTDIPMITGTTWEPRAMMDVEFRNTVRIVDNVGCITRVRGTGAGDESVTVTLNAP